MPTKKETDAFLSKVERVHQQVKDIIDGKIELDDVDREEYEILK